MHKRRHYVFVFLLLALIFVLLMLSSIFTQTPIAPLGTTSLEPDRVQ